ncbi:hypothetical protein JR316_0010604 [Psilocybe cubensis]|uniref:Uncharacterized protein n=2 Tax=Psilocybe cubensis TaxID=181762 RepID=A0A8H7XTV0_PSICU|nr:hypothetical protein JR316_0010604 [Psilocybe cubensis]KAH9476690.1 hypothetical protein JR316_0010604 [Psilocybe cubensis]
MNHLEVEKYRTQTNKPSSARPTSNHITISSRHLEGPRWGSRRILLNKTELKVLTNEPENRFVCHSLSPSTTLTELTKSKRWYENEEDVADWPVHPSEFKEPPQGWSLPLLPPRWVLDGNVSYRVLGFPLRYSDFIRFAEKKWHEDAKDVEDSPVHPTAEFKEPPEGWTLPPFPPRWVPRGNVSYRVLGFPLRWSDFIRFAEQHELEVGESEWDKASAAFSDMMDYLVDYKCQFAEIAIGDAEVPVILVADNSKMKHLKHPKEAKRIYFVQTYLGLKRPPVWLFHRQRMRDNIKLEKWFDEEDVENEEQSQQDGKTDHALEKIENSEQAPLGISSQIDDDKSK